MASPPLYRQHSSERGSSIHYTLYGNRNGRPVVLLHGLGGSGETFTALLPYLPAECNTISVDFEGFGKTPFQRTDSKLSVDQYVADVDDLIQALQLHDRSNDSGAGEGSITFIGHSLGSVVALKYAAKRPKTIAGLCLLGVGRSAAHIPAARDRMQGMASKVRKEGIGAAAELAMQTNFPVDASHAEREEVRKAVQESDPEAYAQVCEAMVDASHKDPDYSAIKCPTMFIVGADDTISPPARSQDVAKLMGGPCTIRIVNSGHQPIISDLPKTGEAVRGFLGSLLG
jgi:3-oxoadipate enol-lactonase